jgi:HPt (histidine-containing phosphotransfer) domain-containing protein
VFYVTFAAIAGVPAPYHRHYPESTMSEPLSPQPPTAAVVLDEASLQRLHELDPEGTNQVVQRVLRAFETSLQRMLPQSMQALAQGDHEAVRHVVHTLKSSSASVGALALSRRCGEIENRLRVLQSQDLDTLMDGLNTEGQRVLAAVQVVLYA